MVALKDRMREHFEGWQADLPPNSSWPDFFEECDLPDFEAIPDACEIEGNARVWPGRRGANLQGAPEGAHVCRAFDGIELEDVRVVVLGQDPYPSITQATGRAFEDGAWKAGGRPQELAASIKPLMLAALATCDDRAALFRARSWPEVRGLIQNEHLVLPTIEDYFDALAEQGVLFVNAAWTHTRKSDVTVHLKLWQPVLHYFFRKVARHAQAPLLFVLLGKKAQARFAASGAEAEARRVGIWGNRVVGVDLPHPIDSEFFGQNPWSHVNQLLLDLNTQPVDWWPQLPPVVQA